MITSISSSVGRRISLNYISLLLIQVTNLILPIVTFPYLIRVIGTEKFGLIAFAQSICLILYVFVDYGFSLSATRRISIIREDKHKLSETFSTVLFVKGTIAILLFIIYVGATYAIPKLREEQAVFLLSYVVIVGQTIFPDWFFQGIEKMKIMAVISLIAKVIFTGLIFLIITDSNDYVLVPLMHGLGYVLAGILSLVLAKRYVYLVRPNFMISKDLLKESFSLFLSNLAARVINNVPIILLGIIANDTYVGVYSSIEKLIATTKGVFVSLYQAIYPWLSNQARQKQRSYALKMIPVVSLFAGVVMLPFLVFGKTLLGLLYDDPLIISNGYLIYFLAFNLLSAALYMLFIMHYFPAAGNFIARLKIITYVALVSLIIGFILVSKLGLLGAVYTSISIELLLAVFSIVFFLREKDKISQAHIT